MATNQYPLQERTVVITGATTQVGTGVATALAELGASIAIIDKNLDKAQRLADFIMDQREVEPSRGKAAAIQADLAKPHHAKEAVSRATEYFGGVDIYVDALTIARSFSFESEGFFEELERFVDVNLKAPLYLTYEILRFMKAKKRGRIVYFIQDISRIGYAGETLGAVSRSGLIGFSRSLARDVAPFNITVNCLAVGPTEEYLLMRDPRASSIHHAQQELLKSIPQAKMTMPEDVAGVVAFLAGPASHAITGQTLVASGGLTMTT